MMMNGSNEIINKIKVVFFYLFELLPWGQFHVPPVTFVPTCDCRFHQPETQGEYLGEPVPMA